MRAAGLPDQDAAVRALAVAALTIACLLHGLWRKGGIVVNNVLALVKVATLLAIIGMGFAAGAGASFGAGPVGRVAIKQNFNVHTSFAPGKGNVGDYSAAILFIVYSFFGFQQPFYVSVKQFEALRARVPLTWSSKVLSEVNEPKKRFAKTTIGTMILVVILFVLANIAYVCHPVWAFILAYGSPVVCGKKGANIRQQT